MARATGKERDLAQGIQISPESARVRLIKAATALFFRFGINATGVDAIVEAAGTAKATLYKAFGSKEGLVEAVLAAEGEAWRLWFKRTLNDRDGTPREKLVRIFDVLEEWFADERFYGCPFINAVGEFDKKGEHYKRLALAHKRFVTDHIAELARKADCKDAVAVAEQLGMLIDGATTTALITGDPKVAQTARAAAAGIVGVG